jgi:hypothetical protein
VPAAGATGVPTDATVEVTWSKAMPASTSFTVAGPDGTVDGSFAYDADTRTVTFTPDALEEATTYDVTVTGRTSADGDAQQVPVTFSFTTATGPDEPLPADFRTWLLTTYGTTTGWDAHLAADVTGNGFADLVSYHPSKGRWWVTESLGDGDFADPELLTTYNTTTGWAAHLAGDVTGNGFADLVSYHPQRGRWWVTESLGEGAFAKPRLLTTYATTEGWDTHLVADVTGNGFADLVSYHPQRGRWWVTESLGEGAFAEPELLTTYNTTRGWAAHVAADVTGNGFADLVSYHPQRGRWWVTESLGEGDFAEPELLTTYATTEGWDAHLVADVTGNGFADLLSYHPSKGRWWVTESLGEGDFAEPRLLTTYNTTSGWTAHLAADVTGNGVADLLSYHPNRGRWWVTSDVSRPVR